MASPFRVWVKPYFLGFSLGIFLLLAQHYWMGTIHWSHWFGLLVRPLQKPDCPTVALYWQWPDTFLPGSMDAAVWRPTEHQLDNGTFILEWDRQTQAYRHANETRYLPLLYFLFVYNAACRFGVTQASPPVKAALTWKLVLPDNLKVCRVQLFSNSNSNNRGLQLVNSNAKIEQSDGNLLREWWREELWQSGELLVVAILTNQCHLDSLQWRVATATSGKCWKPIKQRPHWSSAFYELF